MDIHFVAVSGIGIIAVLRGFHQHYVLFWDRSLDRKVQTLLAWRLGSTAIDSIGFVFAFVVAIFGNCLHAEKTQRQE